MNFLNEAWISLREFTLDMAVMLTFVGIVLAAVLVNAFVIRKESFNRWKEEEGEGATASAGVGIFSIIGIAFIGALIVFIASALFSSEAKAGAYSDMFKNGSWNNGAYAFIGVDYTFKTSPQCVEGTADDQATSNMGFGWQAWRSYNKRHEANLQMTHHSCVIGKDRNGYDGAGFQYKYWFYRK